MKTSDLWIQPEVGQYWFDTHGQAVHKITEVLENGVVIFDEGKMQAVPPLRSSFVHMWYTGLLPLKWFKWFDDSKAAPKPGQVWVSNETQELFIVHPDQSDVPDRTVRILSDSSRTEGPANPLHENP